MIFSELKLRGAWTIDLERIEDARGFFARIWSREEFAARGLDVDFAQSSLSFNPKKGTLRGMHFQAAPYQETKLVRCTRGAIYDVIVDLRPDSPTRLQWVAVELSADNRRALYIPRDFAHGFQTLTGETEVFYQITTGYRPESARGLRWDDPALGIDWPLKVSCISERDQRYQPIAQL